MTLKDNEENYATIFDDIGLYNTNFYSDEVCCEFCNKIDYDSDNETIFLLRDINKSDNEYKNCSIHHTAYDKSICNNCFDKNIDNVNKNYRKFKIPNT
ncbi:MAG: hypothetical protein K0S67_3 [Nitrososphaeraceae archaeon]|jgi:hypothetical protein|nr:hypothetical protein [Nitrososphaeraceae archaeon]